MPWTPEQFRAKHNKKLTFDQASRAAAMATAMINSGTPEGEAIATANARVSGMKPHRALSQLIKKGKKP